MMIICLLKSGRLLKLKFRSQSELERELDGRVEFLGHEDGEDYFVNYYLVDGNTPMTVFHSKEYLEFEPDDIEILKAMIYGDE